MLSQFVHVRLLRIL